MKFFKRITSVVLAVVIIVLMLPSVSTFAATTDISRYGRTKLSSNLQKVYDSLVVCYSNNTPTKVEIDENWNITPEKLLTAFRMFYSDFPEFFWAENGEYSYSYTSDNIVTSFTPIYNISNVAEAKTKYNQKVKELTSGLDGKSDYEKSKILHDRLCKNTTYTYNCDNHQSSYGALVDKKAVCNGYARAYQHLLNEVGITAWYVNGKSINPTTNEYENHAWNMVKLDGNWYHSDVTWDDQASNIFYSYFNVTSKQIFTDHILDDTYTNIVPAATATAANYYKKEGRIFSSYDQKRFVELLRKDNRKTQIYISGNVNNFLNSIDMLSIAEQLSNSTDFSVTQRTSRLGNAFIFEFDIKDTHKHSYSSNCDATCNTCGAKRNISHTYKTTTTKATLTSNGSIVKKCTVCGKVASNTAIKYAKTFKLSSTVLTYNGKVRKPSVIVKDSAGKTLKQGEDYTVAYASGRKNVGTYKVTVKMIGKYSGTKTLTFKINPAPISSYKLSSTVLTYNGKVRTPSVIVKNSAGAKLSTASYTATYQAGRKNVGTYKVTIKGKGNYTGTKTLTFKIVPRAASINKLTAKSKAITVKLNRSLKQSTGYQIQYSTSKAFTNAKTKTVTSYKTSTSTLSGLKAKTTYYVRVRTYKIIGKNKYYSNWSTYKYVKTK